MTHFELNSTTVTSDLSDLARLCSSLLDYGMLPHQVRRVLWEHTRYQLTPEEMTRVMTEAQDETFFTS